MSATRRQETLETFCVPIEHDSEETSNVQPVLDVPTSELRQTRRSARSSRRSEASGGEYQQAGVMPTNGDDDDDNDFLLETTVDSDDDVDSTGPPSKKRKTKAKDKGKGKGKAATRSRAALPISNGVNPKVMLISLKAGALGLNLTVANNIYL